MDPDSVIEVARDAIATDDAPVWSSPRKKQSSAKVRENQDIEDATVVKNTRKAPRSVTNNGNQPKDNATPDPTSWQKILEVLGNTLSEIKSLKEVVIQQQDTIKELREHVEHIQGQLDALSNNAAQIVSGNINPSPSYAEVARTPTNSAPGNVASISSMGTTPSTMTDTLYCTVDTSRVASDDVDKVTAGAIRATVEKSIREINEQANWRCRAVTKDPKNLHRVRIARRNEAEHKEVKRVVEANLVQGHGSSETTSTPSEWIASTGRLCSTRRVMSEPGLPKRLAKKTTPKSPK